MPGRQQVLHEQQLSLCLSQESADHCLPQRVCRLYAEASWGPRVWGLDQLGVTHESRQASLTHIYPKAKASGKKLQKVTLKVSPRGIILTDNITNQLIENVSIYR